MSDKPGSDLPPSSMEVDQKRRGSRKGLWIIGGVLLVTCLCCGGPIGAFVAIFSGASGIIKSSEPYQHAVDTAKADPRVIAALGEPIKEGMMPTGNVNFSNSSGDANLVIPISGPNGSGTIFVEAKQMGGPWEYNKLEVLIPLTNERINLNQPPDAGEL